MISTHLTCGNEETNEARGGSRRDSGSSLNFPKVHPLHTAAGSDGKDMRLQSFKKSLVTLLGNHLSPATSSQGQK